jgi:pimeloyl-ACP methyl ester carboxylesterase
LAEVEVRTVTQPAAVTSVLEEPLFFRAGRETLFGVFSRPPKESASPAVVVLGGGGTTPTSTGRNRFYVALCRRLAALGYHTLRFDYHGLGDSTGSAEFRLDRPFIDDLRGALAAVAERGVRRFVLVGSCFGARTALAAAPHLDGLCGLVLLAPPVRDYGLSEPRTAGWRLPDYAIAIVRPRRLLGTGEKITFRRYARFIRSGVRLVLRRLRDRLPGTRETSWVARRFIEPLASMARSGVPVLLLYGTEDDEYLDFRAACDGPLARIVDASGDVRVKTLDGQVHGFTRVDSQGPTIETVVDDILRNVPPDQ